MKHLILLLCVVAVVAAGCTPGPASPNKATAVKTSGSSGQFRGSDHMPPAARAAKAAAGL